MQNEPNTEELMIGLLFPLAFVWWIGWWCLIACPLSSYFWALTGQGGSKLFRRLGCPLLVCIGFFIHYHHWQAFLPLPLAFGTLSIGYGIPDSTDKGSALGRFWFNHSRYANTLTRLTIYSLLAISYIPAIIWTK